MALNTFVVVGVLLFALTLWKRISRTRREGRSARLKKLPGPRGTIASYILTETSWARQNSNIVKEATNRDVVLYRVPNYRLCTRRPGEERLYQVRGVGEGIWANIPSKLGWTQPHMDIVGRSCQRLVGEEGSHILRPPSYPCTY